MNNEVNIENDVNKKLNGIIEQQIQVIQKQKRVVAKCHQDNEAAKQKHQVSIFLFGVNYVFFCTEEWRKEIFVQGKDIYLKV